MKFTDIFGNDDKRLERLRELSARVGDTQPGERAELYKEIHALQTALAGSSFSPPKMKAVKPSGRGK